MKPKRIWAAINQGETRRLFWIFQISGWLLFAAVFCLIEVLGKRFSPTTFVNYGSAAAAGFFATLLLHFLYKKTRIWDRSIVILCLLTIIGSILAANLMIGMANLMRYPFWGMRALSAYSAPMAYLLRFVRWFIWILGWSALYLGFKFWRQWEVQKEQTEKANALAQAAHLQMLRYRMNPHFLFNSLNSIRALIAENKTSAKFMVTELSEFLRYSLVSRNYENVPMKDEIESIRHYANIQKMRYENKLDVAVEVEAAAEDFPIASFLLYPLMENAVKHGMATSSLPLKVQVQVTLQGGNLVVEIRNSGSWIESPEKQREGVIRNGLDIVRQRLADAYPNRHRLEISEAGGWVLVKLTIDKGKKE